jgi:antitoxin MazE
MKARIVKIGNSQGIRIPKPFLHQTGLGGEVEISMEDNRLVIGPAHRTRAGWAESFKAMAKLGEDHLLEGKSALPTDWEEEGWEWK